MRRLSSLVAATLLGLLAGTALSAPAHAVGGEQLDAKGVQANLLPDASPLPSVQAKAWVLADAQTGAILASKNAHLQRPPASTLKMLTALTVLPQVDVSQTYIARRSDAQAGGTRVGIIPGKTYTLDDLFYALFLKSGNDAAKAIAHANGGIDKTVAQMNEVAASLQAYDTVAMTPNGLDRPGQVSTAYDLALIGRAGLARADFAHYASTVTHEFPTWKGKNLNKPATFAIYTQNRMLLHGFDGAIGVKTGFTTNAGRTFVGAASRDGTTLLVSLLGVTEPTETAAEKLLEWGFANVGDVTPVGELVGPATQTTTATADATSATALSAGSTSTGSMSTGSTNTEAASSEPLMTDAELQAAGISVGVTNEIQAPVGSWVFLGVVVLAGLAFLVRMVRVRRRHGGAPATIGTSPSHERIRIKY